MQQSDSQVLRASGITAAREYQDLPAWQKAIALAERVYQETEGFPEREYAGLALMMRQSSIGIAAALAAASAKANEHGMFASYQLGQSLAAEFATQLTIAQRLGYIAADSELVTQLDEVNRLIIALKQGLKIEAKDTERKERHAERDERERRPKREFRDRDDRGGDRPYQKREGGDRPYKSRDDRGGPQSQEERQYKKPYQKREGGDRPYQKREGGDRPYQKREGGDKPYQKREGGGGDRPYKKREDRGGDRPYKARDDRGPRKPYRDKE